MVVCFYIPTSYIIYISKNRTVYIIIQDAEIMVNYYFNINLQFHKGIYRIEVKGFSIFISFLKYLIILKIKVCFNFKFYLINMSIYVTLSRIINYYFFVV